MKIKVQVTKVTFSSYSRATSNSWFLDTPPVQFRVQIRNFISRVCQNIALVCKVLKHIHHSDLFTAVAD